MEKEIAAMEAKQHIDKIEKIKMAGKLRTKEALIDIQAEKLSNIGLDFTEKCKERRTIRRSLRRSWRA